MQHPDNKKTFRDQNHPCPIFWCDVPSWVSLTWQSCRNLWWCKSGCGVLRDSSAPQAKRIRLASCHRSKASNKVTGKQSLSRKKVLAWEGSKSRKDKSASPGGMDIANPASSVAGKKHSSARFPMGPVICKRLSHQAAAAGQCGRPGSLVA